MSEKIRAGWIRPFAFTSEQRAQLATVLRRLNREKVDAYLTEIQAAVVWLRHEMDVTGTVPPERPAQSLSVLSRIAKHSRGLDEALKELDLTGSEVPLAVMLDRLGRGMETVEYLLNDLPILALSADGAAKYIAEPKRGRPSDEVERRFIASIGKSYVDCFGVKPTYSRGSVFPDFVSAVFEIVMPGNPHSARDNAKIVAAALRDAKVID